MPNLDISPIHALALCDPKSIDDFPDELLALLAFDSDLWLRPDQRVEPGNWRSFGFLCGRGFGKTLGIASEIQRRVEAREIIAPCLVAPTEERVFEVQVRALLSVSTPWCRAEPYAKGVRWANGVTAVGATAAIPRPSSGSNYDFVWMTEIVRWDPSTRLAAFRDITTACRAGKKPQYVWDTTSQGDNEVITTLLAQHEANPAMHRLRNGTIYDNPVLSEQYVKDEIAKYGRGSQEYFEELEGKVFAQAGGALWRYEWIQTHRAAAVPDRFDVAVLAIDPALSGDPRADEVGMSVCYASRGQYFVRDLSAHLEPEEYADLAIRECERDCAGIVVERNHVGSHARDLIKVHAQLKGYKVVLVNDEGPFPNREQGVIFVREVVSTVSKGTRAAPVAALYRAGRVHHVGVLADLERQQTTWIPGAGKSPNRIDALVFGVAELAGIHRDMRVDSGANMQAASQIQKLLATGSKRNRRTI
jgi:phage terminase large subunit-like protein